VTYKLEIVEFDGKSHHGYGIPFCVVKKEQKVYLMNVSGWHYDLYRTIGVDEGKKEVDTWGRIGYSENKVLYFYSEKIKAVEKLLLKYIEENGVPIYNYHTQELEWKK
jgi:hypothetical protein